MSVTVRLSLSLRRASNEIGCCFWRLLAWASIHIFLLYKTFTIFSWNYALNRTNMYLRPPVLSPILVFTRRCKAAAKKRSKYGRYNLQSYTIASAFSITNPCIASNSGHGSNRSSVLFNTSSAVSAGAILI